MKKPALGGLCGVGRLVSISSFRSSANRATSTQA
jgi:protein subunit release factor B